MLGPHVTGDLNVTSEALIFSLAFDYSHCTMYMYMYVHRVIQCAIHTSKWSSVRQKHVQCSVRPHSALYLEKCCALKLKIIIRYLV